MPSSSIAVPGASRRHGPTLLQARQLFVYVMQGLTYAEAYRRVFQHRNVGTVAASRQGGIIFREYQEKHQEDAAEAAKRAGIDPDRYFKKLDQLLEAKTLDEVIKTELLDTGNGKAKTVTTRNTVEVIDNATQLGAVKEVGRALGIVKDDHDSASQTNINVLVVTSGIRKQRQRRITQEEE